MNPKNYQNYTWINLCSLLPVQIVLMWNPNSIITLTPNLTESFSTLYNSSSEILRFVNIVWDRLSKTFSIFYYSLHVWHHEILTNLMIFRLHLFFLEFKNHLATRLWSCFLNKLFEISFYLLGKTSHWTQ